MHSLMRIKWEEDLPTTMGTTDETKVNDRGGVTIPSEVRDALDIEAGDKLRWTVEAGVLSVEVVHQEEGVFEDFEPTPMGGDGAVAHNTTGSER